MRKSHLLILFVLSFALAGCGLFSSPAPTPKLTIEVAGTGLGSVTSSPEGIDCGTTCTLASDKEIVLTATPAAGSTFTKWDGCETATENTCTITLKEDKTITATFDKTATGQYSGKIMFFNSEFNAGNGFLANMQLDAKDNGYTGTVTPLANIGLPTIPLTCGAIADDNTLTCNLTVAGIDGTPETIELSGTISGTTKFSGSSSVNATVNGTLTDRIDFDFTTDSYVSEKTEINPNDPKPSIEGIYKGPLELETPQLPNTFTSFVAELAITLENGSNISALTLIPPPGAPSTTEKGTCGDLDSNNILICDVNVQGGIFKFTGELTDTSYSGKLEGIPPAEFPGESFDGNFDFSRQ